MCASVCPDECEHNAQLHIYEQKQCEQKSIAVNTFVRLFILQNDDGERREKKTPPKRNQTKRSDFVSLNGVFEHMLMDSTGTSIFAAGRRASR